MRATNRYRDATGWLETKPHNSVVIVFKGSPEIIPSDEIRGPVDPSTAKSCLFQTEPQNSCHISSVPDAWE